MSKGNEYRVTTHHMNPQCRFVKRQSNAMVLMRLLYIYFRFQCISLLLNPQLLASGLAKFSHLVQTQPFKWFREPRNMIVIMACFPSISM